MGKYLRRKPILERDQGQALIYSKLILLDKFSISESKNGIVLSSETTAMRKVNILVQCPVK